MNPLQDKRLSDSTKFEMFQSAFHLFKNEKSDENTAQAYSYFEDIINNQKPISIQSHEADNIHSLTVEFVDPKDKNLVSISLIIDYDDRLVLTGTGKHDLLIEQNLDKLNIVSAHLLSKPS